jgi:condensin-2 complex subunit H2
MELENERESRFAHLLKPIRELADNWDIDIASELLEYLEELDKLVIELEGGDLNLNFAEAALLVQGSAMVYSNKVEFLYSLVFKTLDLLCEARVAGKAAGAEQERDDARARRRRRSVVNMGAEAREFFLLLDDEIAVGKNIDLGPGECGEEEGEEEEGGRGEGDRRKSLHAATGLRERVPLALLASRPGANETSGAFRMMTCDMSVSGALLLDEAGEGAGESEESRAIAAAALAPSPRLAAAPGLAGDDEQAAFNDGGDDGGYALADDAEDQGTGAAAAAEEEDDRDAARDEQGGRGLAAGAAGEAPEEHESEQLDPWARLDPHEPADPADVAPLKVARTWVTPPALKKSAAEQQAERAKELAVSDLLVSVALQPRLALRLRPGTVLLPEMRGYATERRRARRAGAGARRGAKRDQGAEPQDDDQEQDEHEGQEEYLARLMVSGLADAAGAPTAPGDEPRQLGADDDDVFGGGAGGYDDGDDAGGGFFPAPDLDREEVGLAQLQLDQAAMGRAQDSYVDMVKAHLARYLESANAWAQESGLHLRVRRWEDKIEPFLAEQNARPAFDIHKYGGRILEELGHGRAAAAAGTAFEDLSARLARADAQDQRRHAGSIADSDAEDADEDEDRNAAPGDGDGDGDGGLDRYQVCRLFLASLQLANDGNVELLHETSCSQLRIRVLDDVLANTKLELAKLDDDVLLPSKKRAKKQAARLLDPVREIENL